MKTLLLILTLALGSNLMAEGYNAAKAHEDSLFIYNVYKDQIQFLENATKDMNYLAWYGRSNHDDSITTCAKLRLKRWNKKDYEMAGIKEYEGFGTAYLFPSPGTTNTLKSSPAKPATETKVTETKVIAPVTDKKIKFSIIDAQTKFITRPDGKTKTPYIEKTNFDSNGRVVSVEQLYSMAN